MMSVGLHCRLTGRPTQIGALSRFLDYIQQRDRVWLCRRTYIARHWHEHHYEEGEGVRVKGLEFFGTLRVINKIFMVSQALFIVELLVISAILSVAIKFAPISIPATTTNALIGILSPTVVMAIALLSRYARSRRQQRIL